jgi:TolB-like protein
MADRPLASYTGAAPYFFVSYGHDDAELVHPEIRALQDAGFKLWYDEGIHVGVVWRQAIADALSNAAGMIFLATRSSVESDNCLKELNFALDEGKPVLVLKLDDTRLPSLMRLSLSDRQMLDRSDFSDDAYRARLMDAMSAIVPPAQPPDAESQRMPTQVPSIALQALATADEETAFWAEGLVDDLAAPLGQRWFRISLTHNAERDPATLGRALDVRYVLSGSVRRHDNRYRVHLKLTRSDTGTHVWSGRYSEAGDAIEISDAICRVAAIDVSAAVMRDEQERAVKIDDAELDAWGLCLKALGGGMPMTMQARDERVRRLRLAEQRDPEFAMPHCLLGNFLCGSVFTLFSRTADEDARESLAHVDRALALAPGNPVVMQAAVMPHRVFGNENLALDLAERANAAGGSDAFFGINYISNMLFGCLIQLGREDDALERMLDSKPAPERMLATAYAVKGDWPAALKWARRATATYPMSYLAWAEFANALAMCNQLGEAREAIDRVRRIIPTFTFARYEKGVRIAWRNRGRVVEPQLNGLRKLGID